MTEMKHELPARYRVEKTIGSGGMGIVYKARDTYLDKDVAIKMLLISSVDQKLLTRFHREAKIASCLKHSNLITVLDFGVTCDGKPYMVMDYAEGTTLSTLLEKRGSLTIDECMPIFVQICQGLSHAHSKGIIHRDLKPGNIIITEIDGEFPLVKMVDFGLAKPTEAIGDSTLTEVGAVMGSPFYMSPEQAMSKEVDHRTDIYSMGCLMYKTLTDRAPFECETALETLSTKCTQVAPCLDSTNNECPEQLCHMVARCLSIAPEDRYQSIDELLSSLNELSEELHIEPAPIPMIMVPPPKVRSHVMDRLAVYATLLCVIAAMAVFLRPTGTVEPINTEIPAEEEPEFRKAEYRSIEKEAKPDPNVSPTGKIAFSLCGVSPEDEINVRIYKMEKYLKDHPGAFSWAICNELRHHYGKQSATTNKSMEYTDLILRHSIMDDYMMNILSGWEIGKDNQRAVVNLERTRALNKNLKYLGAACSLKAGDLQRRMNNRYLAKAYYLRVSKLQDRDLQAYRNAANARLKSF